MLLRDYQHEAIESVNDYLARHDDHPLCVLPTGSGKTVIFASMIRDWLTAWPETRVLILAHVQELLTQAEAKLLRVWPAAPIGVWCAGLNRKEGSQSITIASIQSIYKRCHDFDPFDIIIVDEAHLIPTDGEGMYRRLLKDAHIANPHVRVIGFTATPYRIKGGYIAAKKHILNSTCYDAPVGRLIADGHICKLRSKGSKAGTIDTTGIRTQNGDFAADELEQRANDDDAVNAAVSDMIRHGADRKSWLVFCCGIAHAFNVSARLCARGIPSRVITGETPADDRAEILRQFDAGELRAVCNVNVLTTGLDVTRIDLIALLRPTQSTSLYVQMCGRGFRLHPGKTDCMILDFGQNVRRHGPLDDIQINKKGKGRDSEKSDPPVKFCPNCEEIVPLGVRECPECGFVFPEREIKHDHKADDVPILSSTEPWIMPVDHVEVRKHEKEGKPPSLCVTYYDGLNREREWICLEHGGFAQAKAAAWWSRRFPGLVPNNVDAALSGDLFLADHLAHMTESITIRRVGKFNEIVGHKLRTDIDAAIAAISK